VKIDREDKALILLSSLPESYYHIITTMLYDKETFILEEVTSTLLSNEIKKISNQDEHEGLDLVVMRKKMIKEKFEFVESTSLLSQGRSLKERLQASKRVIEEKRQTAGANVGEGVSDTYALTASITLLQIKVEY